MTRFACGLLFAMGVAGGSPSAPAALIEVTTVPGSLWSYLPDGSLCATNRSWTEIDFDALAWPASMGLFAAGETAPYPFPFNNVLISTLAGGPRTDYFRTEFDWNMPTSQILFHGTAYVDDGLILYLNGVEVYRFNMGNPGSINYESLTLDCNSSSDSSNPGGEPVIVPMAFSPSVGLLRIGANVLAAELHQFGQSSSDKVFGLELNADFFATPRILTDPAPVHLLQGQTFSLYAEADGVPLPVLQWHRNDLEILGATNDTYTVVDADPELHAGDYYLTASNLAGIATSDVASVTVDYDTQPPVLERATLWLDGTLRMTFDEVMDGTYFDSPRIRIVRRGEPDPISSVQSAQLVEPDTLVFTLSPLLDTAEHYDVFLDSGAVRDRFLNEIADTSMPLGVQVELLEWDALWRYDDSSPSQDLFSTNPPFTAEAFDDSGWKSGPGAFGTEANPLGGGAVLNTRILNPGAGGPLVIYFRHWLTLPAPKSEITSIQMYAVYDDGAVLSLNGVEYLRLSMPAGPVDVASRGISHESNTEEGPFELSLDDLNEGQNLLAVSLHAADSGSSDSVWALRLVAELRSVPETEAPRIVTQPTQPGAIQEGQGFTLTVEATGNPQPEYQWRFNGQAIPGATDAVYSVANANQPTHQGNYDVVVSNPRGSTASTVITITVLPDTVAPTVIAAVGKLDPTQIVVRFSEPVTAATATNLAHYALQPRGGGGAPSIVHAQLSNFDTVTLTSSPRAQDYYTLSLIGIQDTAFLPNTLIPAKVLLLQEILLVEGSHYWKHQDLGTDLGPALSDGGWATADYDDSAWPSGQATFYNRLPGDGSLDGTLEEPLRTRLALFTPTDSRVLTYYFRGILPIDTDVHLASIHFQLLVDDGAIVYANGKEVFRVRMPDGPVDYATPATAANGTDLSYEDPFRVPAESLGLGDNLVAVEVHQSAPTSPDTAFALRALRYDYPPELQLRVTRIALDATGNILLVHNGPVLGVSVKFQQTVALGRTSDQTVWSDMAGAPHGNPFNAGRAAGLRFFRAVAQ